MNCSTSLSDNSSWLRTLRKGCIWIKTHPRDTNVSIIEQLRTLGCYLDPPHTTVKTRKVTGMIASVNKTPSLSGHLQLLKSYFSPCLLIILFEVHPFKVKVIYSNVIQPEGVWCDVTRGSDLIPCSFHVFHTDVFSWIRAVTWLMLLAFLLA